MWLKLDKRTTVSRGFACVVSGGGGGGRRSLRRAVHGVRGRHKRVTQTAINALKVLATAGRGSRRPKLVMRSAWIHACECSADDPTENELLS